MIELPGTWWSVIVLTALATAPMVLAWWKRAEHIWLVLGLNIGAFLTPFGLLLWVAALGLAILDRREVLA